MCGLAGFSAKIIKKKDEDKVKSMSKFLIHRGPDSSGFYKKRDIIMLHRRLSIIDIDGGNQPILNGNALIANAEIYNDPEIRLKNQDFKYKTSSDCESLLAIYNKFGLEGFKKIRGMYAFALYDTNKEHLILGRDPFGIKPLYFCKTENGIAFSSEIQALINSNFINTNIDMEKVKESLQIQFNVDRKTIYNGILRVRPGEILILKKGKIISSNIISKLENLEKKKFAHNDVRKVLENSVMLHQRSDVPYGVFFSGGIDSTLILYLLSRLNSSRTRAFSVTFPGISNNKDQLIDLAKKFNSELRFINFSENDFWDLIPISAKYMDDPITDYAVVPTFKLAQEASKTLKVVLTGEGGDEIFSGYGRYRASKRNFFFKKKPFGKGAFDSFKEMSKKLEGWNYDLDAARFSLENANLTDLQKSQYLDCQEWLPNNLLIKLDRCLMANSIEGRTPLVDINIFSYFFKFDDRLKINKGYGKYFLRKFLSEEIPFFKAFEKKKGFTVPLKLWLPKKKKELMHILPKNKFLKEIFPSSMIKDLCSNLNNKKALMPVWRLIFLSIWYLIHIENKKIEGNTFDMLTNNI